MLVVLCPVMGFWFFCKIRWNQIAFVKNSWFSIWSRDSCRDHCHCPALFTYSVCQKGYFPPFPLTMGISNLLISLLSRSFTLFHLINLFDICCTSNRLSIAMLIFNMSSSACLSHRPEAEHLKDSYHHLPSNLLANLITIPSMCKSYTLE